MAEITFEGVTLDFPIYGQRSFRQALFSRSVGGLIVSSGPRQVPTVRALDNITLSIHDGDRVGLVGPNGAGKSTLLRTIAGVYQPTGGRLAKTGRVTPLFNPGMGMDPDDNGYENILSIGLHLGMSRAEIRNKTEEIATFAELGDFLNLPVRIYSAGMQIRLAFAVATAIDPEILLLDEGLGAGDARFADKARKRVDQLIMRSSVLVLASHSTDLIELMCNKAVLLDHGRVLAAGPTRDVLNLYRNKIVTAA